MQYFITFLEGMITFISPCLLPMLPAYVSYFAGGGQRKASKTLKNALGFVLGFTVVFVLLGAFAGAAGSFLARYRVVVNIITGLVVIFFGLSYLGVFQLNIFKGIRSGGLRPDNFFSAFVFGVVFSVGWTPCVGAFLGSALMLASQQGRTLDGIIMLLLYSAGLGIPFLISALLIDRLKGAFNFIKRNYRIINMVSGILLIVLGVLMATGLLSRIIDMLVGQGALL